MIEVRDGERKMSERELLERVVEILKSQGTRVVGEAVTNMIQGYSDHCRKAKEASESESDDLVFQHGSDSIAHALGAIVLLFNQLLESGFEIDELMSFLCRAAVMSSTGEDPLPRIQSVLGHGNGGGEVH